MLGKILKSRRAALSLTLREVEAATGISNGYLSQLESDAIRSPSPIHLQRLAETYDLAYDDLMRASGYAPVQAKHESGGLIASGSILGLEELTEEDRGKIQAYVDDLRAARIARANGSAVTRRGTVG